MKKIKNNILKILDYKYMSKILFFLEFVLSILSSSILLMNLMTDNVLYKYIFLGLLLFLGLIILLLFIKYYKKIEFLFLILSIPLGLSYAILMLPNRVPDENAHIARSYTVATGDFFVSKNKKNIPIMKVPSFFENNNFDEITGYKKLYKAVTKKTNYKKVVKTIFNPAAGYPFVAYLIPSIGINVGKILNLNFYLSVYLGRILNVILFIIVGFIVIKIIPFGKLFMFVYMLTPMFLQQGASLSSDAFINCCSLLFISYILYLKFSDKNKSLSLNNIIILGILMVLISICKIVYFPLIFAIFLLNKKIKNSISRDRKVLYVFIILSLIMAIAFYFISSIYLVHISRVVSEKVNSSGQIKYILSNPISYLKVLIKTLLINIDLYVGSFFGEILSFLNIRTKNIFTIILVLLFAFAPFVSSNKIEFSKREKILLNVIVFIILNCVFGAMYLSWNGVGSDVIGGVQGRYFIPCIFLVFLTLISVKKSLNMNIRKTNLIYFVLIMLIDVNALICIIKNFM